jgi:hypothetical protein
MVKSASAPMRPYRLYLCGGTTLRTRRHDADLASDKDARELAALMLDEQPAYPCVEIWDRARLVCTLRRGE